MKKRYKILIGYAIFIGIALIFILFIAPDELFVKKSRNVNSDNEAVKERYVDYEMQKDNILNNNYEYEYNLIDSRGKSPLEYNCTGNVIDGKTTGQCTLPTKVSYTDDNFAEVFKNVETDYLKPKFIFELIKSLEEKKIDYGSYREFIYHTKIDQLETEIAVRTDYDSIQDIVVANGYMQYYIKFNTQEIDK